MFIRLTLFYLIIRLEMNSKIIVSTYQNSKIIASHLPK